jgi:hypothetical protein
MIGLTLRLQILRQRYMRRFFIMELGVMPESGLKSASQLKDTAWKYVHHSQLVLDGTFGICSARLLLFIALRKDEDGKGVPVAFFLFSAPTGNKATHAGYNTEILRELLSHWKGTMGSKPSVNVCLETFMPYVAITDTDTKERGALLAVWPEICLLLCRFHLRQCLSEFKICCYNVFGVLTGIIAELRPPNDVVTPIDCCNGWL